MVGEGKNVNGHEKSFVDCYVHSTSFVFSRQQPSQVINQVINQATTTILSSPYDKASIQTKYIEAPAMAYLDLDWRVCVSRNERIERLDQIWHDIANNQSVKGMNPRPAKSSWRLA